MRTSVLFTVFSLTILAIPITGNDQKHLTVSPRILFAKSAYFDDQTGAPIVGRKALVQLEKWGRFQVVPDKKQADLILLLSSDPYKGGQIILSGGQTGTIDPEGHIHEDSVPNYNSAAPVRDVYLTVIDSRTGDNLWSDSCLWGGLLTGFNSAGSRLVKKLEGQTNGLANKLQSQTRRKK